ncbi:NAD-dependent epimerase/dehydratase family protein [Thermococcus stetteri]|uniref:NAD-dependent epimerase/dehydratase family protein n=1 Tax=Thermococcus stetteri TaxID=49900 RepID=UPI001AE462F8|nr:NAD-dependent epimerase/dehydratase family protein [Thermococcus stetteri]MBP1912073.1 NADH dehydrogenase [Thermococcus stetteri]
MMVILTGGTGFIGSFLREELLGRGHEVVVPTRRGVSIPGVKTVRVSGEPEEYGRLVGELNPDVVINLIGVLKGDYHKAHAEIPREIAKACSSCRLIQMSALGADEDSVVPYFKTKALGEKEAKKAESYAIVRPSLVLGPGQRLFRDALKWRVFPKLKTPVQPIDVRDLVKIIADLLERDENLEVNLCGEEIVPLGQLVREVVSLAGKRILLFPVPESFLRFAGKLNPAVLMALKPNICERNDALSFLELTPLEESIRWTAEGLR